MEDAALILAGSIGIVTAIAHGVLTHRLMAQPLLAAAGKHRGIEPSILRLFPLLLQFSTYCWLAGGIALIGVALWADPASRLTTSLFVAGFYLFGAIGNLWGTRGKHFGWVLLAAAVLLIGFGAVKPL